MKRNGFTLIELLIVITILAILAGAITLAINPALQIQKGRDLQRKSDISMIQAYLEQYRHDQSAYPAPPVADRLNNPPCPMSSSLASGGITYMTKIPCDPLGRSAAYNGGNYYYNSNGSTYTLAACLENAGDTDGTTTAPAPAASGRCSSGTYYVVTNQ